MYICIMQPTTLQVEQQIKQLERIFAHEPEQELVNGKVKYNPRYFSLKGKIANLKKKLYESKENDFLAR